MTDTTTTTLLNRIETRRTSDNQKGWAVVGKHGGIEFWFIEPAQDDPWKERLGGVETHQRRPMEYSKSQDTPDHKHCEVIDGPCWHDGTSLWASEHWIPMYEACGEEWVWQELETTYLDRFRSTS